MANRKTMVELIWVADREAWRFYCAQAKERGMRVLEVRDMGGGLRRVEVSLVHGIEAAPP